MNAMARAACILVVCAASVQAAVNVLINGGFETGVLDPWFEDRSSGTVRSWNVSGISPHQGSRSAFALGRLELRQDFPAIPAVEIAEASFYGARSSGSGPAIDILAEWFYSDGSSSGPASFPVTVSSAGSNKVWQLFDMLPHLDRSRIVAGISFTGITGTTTHLDDVRVMAVPEPSAILVAAIGILATCLRRNRESSRNG